MLQFSDTSTKNGIIQRLEYETDLGDAAISGNATLFSQQTAIINKYGSKATSIIITADGDWTWDDTSQADQAVATTDIVLDQGDYTVLQNTPDVDQDYLHPHRVEIMDSAGNWIRLKSKNLRKYGASISEQRTNTGTPSTYDFNGTSIFLDVIPNYNSTGGLKIWFDRAQLNFATTDTTKRPGYASIFHEYQVLGPLYDWQKKNVPEKSEQTFRDLKMMERDMAKYYSKVDNTAPQVVQRAQRKGYYK